MKKTFALAALTLIFILSGCGGAITDNQQQGNTSTTAYETNNFTITIPKAWDVIGKDKFTSDVPAETEVVFRNNVKNETFTANAGVVKRTFQQSTSSMDFAKSVINRQSTGLVDYKEVKKDTVKIKIAGQDTDTLYVQFQARKATNEPLVDYIQTFGVNGNNGFIAYGAYSPEENQNTIQTVESIVKSFQLK